MVKRTSEPPSPGAGEPTPLEIRAALERVLRSRYFEHAARASDFLRFVVGETLAGEADRLKGYTIAIHVFGRPPSFDAQSDPLVRVEALRLRQRLTEYYAGEGAADRVRLELPRGSYAVKAAYAAPQAGLGARARIGVAAIAALAAILVATLALQLRERALDSAPQAYAEHAAHLTRIAVVPLENLSRTPAFARLAASLTEEIMVRLDDLDLYVIALQADWYRPGKALASVLGAEHSYVLTGSVRDNAGGARIALRITEAGTGAVIWSAVYDEPPGIEQRPERQAALVREAAAAAAVFGPVFEAELALARRSSHILEAPDCENRYRAFRRATDPTLFPEALACFQSLVARRPKLAPAWIGLANLALDEHIYFSGAADGGAALVRARAALETALELDSSSVLANFARARYHYYAGDPEFVRSVERTLALAPDNPEVLGVLGILLSAYGDPTHGLELVARAHELAPQPRPLFNLAHVFAQLRDGEPCQALAIARQLDSSKWFIAHMVTAAAAGSCGDAVTAAAARARLLALIPTFEADAVGLVGLWRFEPRLRDAMLSGLRAAGLAIDDVDAPARTR